MATQSINFSATGLPHAGNFINDYDVNTTLQALINDYNQQVGPNKIAPGAIVDSLISTTAAISLSKLSTSSYVDFSGTISPAGWAASPTISIARYNKIGTTNMIDIVVSGTSNSTAVQLTLPFISMVSKAVPILAFDNGNPQVVGQGLFTASSATLVCLPTPTGTGWTASGPKGVSVSCSFESTT